LEKPVTAPWIKSRPELETDIRQFTVDYKCRQSGRWELKRGLSNVSIYIDVLLIR